MSIQAKVRCIGNSTGPHDHDGTSGARIVRFSPVYSSDPEHPNFEWSQATPAGYFEMYVTNPAAHERFQVNHEYMVTFEPEAAKAEAEAEGDDSA